MTDGEGEDQATHHSSRGGGDSGTGPGAGVDAAHRAEPATHRGVDDAANVATHQAERATHQAEQANPGASASGTRDAEERYPVPTSAPRYDSPPVKSTARRGIPLYELIAASSVGVALVCAFRYAYVLIAGANDADGWLPLRLVLFWGLVAYLALPRLHQVFSLIYVPDYFIGRTRTGDGILGDPINIAFDGSDHDVHTAMTRAGWALADDLTVRSSWCTVLAALTRRSYPNAPVSSLYMFGRHQDMAYQQEVEGRISRRHHVRLWRVPEGWALPGGERVGWIASASYDRAVGLSWFTGQITHKIDANIDVERDFLIDTLRYVDPECSVRVIEGFATAYHSRNGGGDAVVTDGDLPIVSLTGAAGRASDAGAPADTVPVPPRDRPVQARREIERARGQRRGAVEWVRADHGVPPVPLICAVVMVAAGAVAAAFSAYGAPGWDELVTFVAHATLAYAGVLAMARRRWAWVVLMAGESAVAAAELFAQGSPDLLASALAVLVLLAVSAPSVRGWVSANGGDVVVPLTREGLSEFVGGLRRRR